MLDGHPGHSWGLCCPLWLHASGPSFRLCEGSDLGTCPLMGWWGSGALAVVGPTRVCLLDIFCSGVQFCLMLCPCLCFVSFLYLDLYVMGDGALVVWGSLVRAWHLCVLIHI